MYDYKVSRTWVRTIQLRYYVFKEQRLTPEHRGQLRGRVQSGNGQAKRRYICWLDLIYGCLNKLLHIRFRFPIFSPPTRLILKPISLGFPAYEFVSQGVLICWLWSFIDVMCPNGWARLKTQSHSGIIIVSNISFNYESFYRFPASGTHWTAY